MIVFWGFVHVPSLKEITSAGILPYAVFKNQVYFLLGKESFDPGFGDGDKWGTFGGKREVNESVAETAAREFYEETAGCVLDLPEIRQKLARQEYLLHSELHPEKSSSSRTYMVLVEYRDYPVFFRRTKHFLQYVGGNINLIEKGHLRWFSYSDVYDAVFYRWGDARYAKKPKFRPKFAEMMRRLMKNTTLEEQCRYSANLRL